MDVTLCYIYVTHVTYMLHYVTCMIGCYTVTAQTWHGYRVGTKAKGNIVDIDKCDFAIMNKESQRQSMILVGRLVSGVSRFSITLNKTGMYQM